MNKIPLVKQKNGWYCGPACLRAVLLANDITMSQRSLAELCGAKKGIGTSNSTLANVLQKLGFEVVVHEEGTWAELHRALLHGKYIIVGWYSDFEPPATWHFSVVSHITPQTISLMDPDIGKILRLSRKQFMSRWHDYDSKEKRPLLRWFLEAKIR